MRAEFAEGAEPLGRKSGLALYKVLWRMLGPAGEGIIFFGASLIEIQSMGMEGKCVKYD